MNNFKALTTSFQCNNETYVIRPVEFRDIELLRQWKNQHAQYFHHKTEISSAEQIRWFEAFETREDQQIFICETHGKSIACVGFKRRGESSVELFNLMCGSVEHRGTGVVSIFFQEMTRLLINVGVFDITLEVLKTNLRAVQWYFRQGFVQVGESEIVKFLTLALDRGATPKSSSTTPAPRPDPASSTRAE